MKEVQKEVNPEQLVTNFS